MQTTLALFLSGCLVLLVTPSQGAPMDAPADPLGMGNFMGMLAIPAQMFETAKNATMEASKMAIDVKGAFAGIPSKTVQEGLKQLQLSNPMGNPMFNPMANPMFNPMGNPMVPINP